MSDTQLCVAGISRHLAELSRASAGMYLRAKDLLWR